MIKYMIRNGASINGRCCGKFFCPEDQKKFVKTSLLTESLIYPVKTSYKGISYLGETPLAHAAVLNQHEAVRILIVHGADPNIQDSNGNSVLHMMVINDNYVRVSLALNSSSSISVYFNKCDINLRTFFKSLLTTQK